MTRQEALEYLNLPANSSNSLVRKRYLELHRDYQKAINNAPSEHFRTLYRENLDKIEEAYLLMKSSFQVQPQTKMAATTQGEKIQQTIREAKELVNTYLKHSNTARPELDKAAKTQISGYIDQITLLQDFLREGVSPVKEPNGNPTLTRNSAQEDLLASVSTLPGIFSGESKEPDPVSIDSISPESHKAATTSVLDLGDLSTVKPDQDKKITQDEDSRAAFEQEIDPPISEKMAHLEVVTPASSNPKIDPQTTRTASYRSSMLNSLLHSKSAMQRNYLFNRLMLGILFFIISLGIGGFIYTFYPIIFPDAPTEILDNQEATEDLPEISIQQIVGDEFFRTGDYLEALVQYTLAVAKNPSSPYLLNQIDSCKALLSQLSITESPKEPMPLATARNPVNNNDVTANLNSANRFRGDEMMESNPFVWSDWAQDSESREQAINSARSARSSTDSTQEPSGDSARFLGPKSSGGASELEIDNEIKNFVDEHPEPVGGYEKFVRLSARKIRYPGEAVRAKVSGMVIVQLIVNKDGSTSDIKVVKGIGYGCDEEALRVVSLFKEWIPGKLNGKIVNARVVIPIYFKIPN